MQDWRADGLGRDTLEIWVVGYPLSGEWIPQFAGDSDASMFVDAEDEGSSVLAAFGAEVNHLFLIARTGTVMESISLADWPLDGSEGASVRHHIDARIRSW